MRNRKYVHLVRHGQTESNKRAIPQDPNESLTGRGLLQAKLLGIHMFTHFDVRNGTSKGIPIDRIITSPLRRATETAKEIHRACGERATLVEVAEFRECAHGETFENRHTRAMLALKLLEALPERNIVVVGHNAFNSLLLHTIIHGDKLTQAIAEHPTFYFPNTGRIILQYKEPVDSKTSCGSWCIIAGDTSHLLCMEDE